MVSDVLHFWSSALHSHGEYVPVRCEAVRRYAPRQSVGVFMSPHQPFILFLPSAKAHSPLLSILKQQLSLLPTHLAGSPHSSFEPNGQHLPAAQAWCSLRSALTSAEGLPLIGFQHHPSPHFLSNLTLPLQEFAVAHPGCGSAATVAYCASTSAASASTTTTSFILSEIARKRDQPLARCRMA